MWHGTWCTQFAVVVVIVLWWSADECFFVVVWLFLLIMFMWIACTGYVALFATVIAGSMFEYAFQWWVLPSASKAWGGPGIGLECYSLRYCCLNADTTWIAGEVSWICLEPCCVVFTAIAILYALLKLRSTSPSCLHCSLLLLHPETKRSSSIWCRVPPKSQCSESSQCT